MTTFSQINLSLITPWLPSLTAFFSLILLKNLYPKVIRWLYHHFTNIFSGEYCEDFLAAFSRPLSFLLWIMAISYAVHHAPIARISDSTTLNHILRSTSIITFFWGCYNLSDATHGLMLKFMAYLGFKHEPTLSNILSTCLKIFISVIGACILAREWNFDVTGILASLGIGSLALALAAKDALANVFGSLIIVMEKPFKAGDWISVNGIEGIVEKISFRSTCIRTFPQELVYIPNSLLSNTSITNYTRRQKRRLDFTLGFTYSSSRQALEKFMQELQTYLENHPQVLSTNGEIVQVNFVSYNSSSLDVRVICYISAADQAEYLKITSAINLDLMEMIDRNGLSCAFPSTSIYMEKN